MLKIIIVLVVGYLLGSISSGVIVSKAFSNTDIRSQGSGNAGTTNMLRVLGRKLALITFAGDLLKGVIAVLIGKAIVGGDLGGVLGVTGAVLGHYFPLYFGFKGGKGIATGFGSLLFVFPLHALAALAVFILLVVLGAAVTWIHLSVVCKKAYPDYYYEGLIAMYGMLTGTISSGVLLLREIDPDLATPSANNLVIGSSFGIILGAPVLILVGLAPKSDLFCWMVIGLVLVYLALLYLLIFKAHRRKK